MKKDNSRYRKSNGEECSYKDFLVMLPYCAKGVQNNLLERLKSQPRPTFLCGVEVPTSLNTLSYGTLDDLRSATAAEDPISECVRILLGVNAEELMDADVNDVFGFLSFVKSELEKINKLFSDIKQTYSKEEEAAGVRDLDFGSFGVLDWYARRMGITNQNDVRDVAWVRIYQCMKNDNIQSEFERRLHKQYMNKNKGKNVDMEELKGTAKYGTVEKKIRTIVESMGADVTYMFKNWAQANDEIDHIDGPTIIYVLPPSGDLDFGYSQVKDYPQSQIAFVASTEFDFEGEENDNIIEQMKRLCICFIKKLNESGLFEMIEGRITYRVLYDYFDQNVTGIVITPPLVEEEGVFICADEYRTEDEVETDND